MKHIKKRAKLTRMMKLKHYPVEKLKTEILAIMGRRLDLKKYRVFFFGSRVEKKSNDRSDIDVGIEGPEAVPPEAWQAIQEEIEKLPTLYKIEIVDFKNTAGIFREVALRHIELLNP